MGFRLPEEVKEERARNLRARFANVSRDTDRSENAAKASRLLIPVLVGLALAAVVYAFVF